MYFGFLCVILQEYVDASTWKKTARDYNEAPAVPGTGFMLLDQVCAKRSCSHVELDYEECVRVASAVSLRPSDVMTEARAVTFIRKPLPVIPEQNICLPLRLP